jgi:hypothetical protein
MLSRIETATIGKYRGSFAGPFALEANYLTAIPFTNRVGLTALHIHV